MERGQISINLESLQDRMGTTAQIMDSMKGLYEAGYRWVEVLHFLNPDDGTSWKNVLDQTGLSCSSIHELFEDIEASPEAMIKKAKELGCRYIAAGLSSYTVWEDEASLKQLTDSLNRLGRQFHAEGLHLLYHNHNMEFAKYDGVHTALEYIFEHTDPIYVGAELDAYWVHLSGGNPVAWCGYLGERLKAIHLKDLGVTGVSTPKCYIKTPSAMGLGMGNLNLPGIIEAAGQAGCRWFIVETHTGWKDNDSLKTAALSYEYLQQFVS